MNTAALEPLYAALRAAARHDKAPAMRAYMRNQFDFLGLPTPLRRATAKPWLKAQKGAGAAALLHLAHTLWQLPQREYQYLAIDLLAMHWKELPLQELPALLALARQKAWWDTVDGLASLVGQVLRGSHEGMDEALAHEDFWLRRIALLHQLGWRDAVDEARLFRYCLSQAHEEEFFIRKAIGWALRDYAHHRPQAVRAFLDTAGAQLSPLSYREAARHLG
ncbi:DNA alkylation repair protein [Pseudoduganella violacea]|uniref:3-methyladenine DNA glycosylase AlkD n=1 Tax=Pseudoduganella violacea TaxID=1715466 RepID=A0A7W5FUN7_9BURK|nr:DNA alkylation repair protein [Pseudoduganella violacea]MBB3119974.1 3-methyladenine DNA glycosylase AlkD [Pseudoduganella violacea]